MLPKDSDNTEVLTLVLKASTLVLKVSTHKAKCRHLTASFLNLELSESALNAFQLPPTVGLISSHCIQVSKYTYEHEIQGYNIH